MALAMSSVAFNSCQKQTIVLFFYRILKPNLLMGKGDDTKRIIIDQALKQAVFLGFESLSIGHLADQLTMSKSGLFAHFKSKEALQLAVLEEAIARFSYAVVTPALRKTEGSERLTTVFDNYLQWIRGGCDTPGCLFLTLLNEYRDKTGPVRERLLKAQDDWHGLIQRLAKEACGSDIDATQFSFEMVGITTAYQQWTNLLNKQKGLPRARQAFADLIQRYRQAA
jgi:AcrR family transcriptional regulator